MVTEEMEYRVNKHKSIVYIIISAVALLLAAVCLFMGCSDDVKPTKSLVTVTLLNGEHYTVSGENKKEVVNDGTVVFDVILDKGYKIIGANGDKLHFTNDLSFGQTVTFRDVCYKTVARLETVALAEYEFSVIANGSDYGDINIDTVLGEVEDNVYYETDIINISVEANDGYRFLCWSTENFLSEGGTFYSSETSLSEFDFTAYRALYANFKDKANTENAVYYRFENGLEIDQDCTALLAHHARANTLTSAEVRAYGVDFGGKMLAGWQTESGKYIGLGSRVTVSKTDNNILLPVWKEYTASDLFAVTADGKITKYHGGKSVGNEVVVPSAIGDMTITAIGANAFEGCTATTYYLPDTITTVENNAFFNCKNLIEFYMSDNIVAIDDKAFTGCENFTTLHLNAVLKPRYNNSTSVKIEVYDRLIANADNGEQKLVLFGDSNVRYGYNSKIINTMFAQSGLNVPEVYNFAVAADMGLYCQYEMCRPYLREGDIFLHAPAEREGSWYGYYANSVITGSEGQRVNYRIFNVTECNWDLLSLITVNKYTNIFGQLCTFNKARLSLKELSYTDYYRLVDDDAIGVRESTEAAFNECGTDKSFNSNGNIVLTDNRKKHIIDIRESAYKYFNENGISLYITFGTINRHNLLLTYNDEQTLKTAADDYTEYVKSLLLGVDCEFLLTQYDAIYDGKHFCDSDLHLGDPFRNEHTEKVISALIEKLKQTNSEVEA